MALAAGASRWQDVAVATSSRSARWRDRLEAFADRLGRQPHLGAVRDGVVAALPMVLIGSTFLLVAQPPSVALQELVADRVQEILLPWRMLGGLIALYVCFGTARSLARHHRLDELGVPLMAVASFLVAVGPVQVEGGGWGLSAERLGAAGLFGALAIALASVELQRWIAARHLTIRLPDKAPEAIVASFASIVPGLASIVGTWALVHLLGFDLVAGLERMARPLVGATDSLPGVLALCLVDSGMWLIGLHPLALMAPLKPIWLAMLAENMNAAATGAPLPHLATREFFLWFVWQGGSGGTLALAILLVRARSRTLKTVGRLGFVPALFNVNEPLLFGVPVVMNPRVAVPFVVAPLLSATTTWFAMSAGWVARPRLDVLWTLPAPVGAFLSTGGDVAAVVLQLANLAMSMAVWWPFVRAWDRKLAEGEGEASPPAAVLAPSA